MKIIISPAKKMTDDSDGLLYIDMPRFLRQAQYLAEHIQSLDYRQAKAMWKCGDAIAQLNYDRFNKINLRRGLVPAILAYRGIQYTQMAPGVFTGDMLNYIQKNLRILSGLYGVLRPFDGIRAYRLEMGAEINMGACKTLYQFWGGQIAQHLFVESKTIINLASNEYSRCVQEYLADDISFITCRFGVIKSGKIAQQGTQVKIARGEMVRFMAENNIQQPRELKSFDRLGYSFRPELSDEALYTFIRDENIKDQ
jgi:hypothetical protein